MKPADELRHFLFWLATKCAFDIGRNHDAHTLVKIWLLHCHEWLDSAPFLSDYLRRAFTLLSCPHRSCSFAKPRAKWPKAFPTDVSRQQNCRVLRMPYFTATHVLDTVSVVAVSISDRFHARSRQDSR